MARSKKVARAIGDNHENAELVYLPLGGSNEIGMNLNAYGYGPADDRQWIIVDIGVSFADHRHPGIDLVLADPSYLEGENVLAIVLTHAHEDHIGAIAHLWPRLRVPIYATPFTALLAGEKLKDRGLDREVRIDVVPLGGSIQIGPFGVDYITLTHSIPEPNALAIRTALGTILHTGDWKLDPDPLVGEVTDIARLQELGDSGVLAMVCDSTNVFVEGEAGSEAQVRQELIRVVAEQTGRVALACFASNVARMESAMMAAEKAGRSVCLVGRSMRRIYGAARAVGLLKSSPTLIQEEDVAHLASNQIMLLCTGSQGEAQAALSRISSGGHKHVRLGSGDSAIFSSRVIPGNEEKIFNLQNSLVDMGVHVITETDRPIHVSGHPCRDELRRMYQWVRPRIAVPTHGERRHIIAHAELARSLQVPEAITPRNGDMVRLAPGPATIIDEVPSGRLLLDGTVLVGEGSDGMRERDQIAMSGVLHVALAMSEAGKLLSGPDIQTLGLPTDDRAKVEAHLESLEDAAETEILRLAPQERSDDEWLEKLLVRVLRKKCLAIWGKRPFITVSLLRV